MDTAWEALLDELEVRAAAVRLGGGTRKIRQQHARGKLTARERIDYLIDDGSSFVEVGLFAGEGMYESYGGCPSGGMIVGIGYVSGRQCVLVANDATIKSGAWFPITAKKNIRAQEICMENRLPIVYLVDSAGIFLPLQDEVFPDKEDFGRQFRNNSLISSMGIVQLSAIMGNCVAGGAYLPAMCDESLIVEKTGTIFLAGSYLVKAAIGEEVDNEVLGGADTHCKISGLTDSKYADDKACLDAIAKIFDGLPEPSFAGFNRRKAVPPRHSPEEIYTLLSPSNRTAYDMKALIACLVDDSAFEEYKAAYGQSIVCCYARIEGWKIGIVANQRKPTKSASGELRMGGVIYAEEANKAARFIMNCNQRRLPLLFLHDVNGFMIGKRAEHGGIIRHGAKMVNAVSNTVVPKFSVVVGNSFGAGNYAMCGRAYDPRLMFAWPNASMGVMSGEAAAKTLWQIKLSADKTKDSSSLGKQEEARMKADMQARYQRTLHPYYASSRLWIDGVIRPTDTRWLIAEGIAAANHAPITRVFNMGILQT